jgi:serine/tyrosine/threonine adenylyltransferase
MDGDKAALPDFSITYGQLPPMFYRHVAATAVAKPQWLLRNDAHAAALGLPAGWLATESALSALAGNAPLPGTTPLAMAYSGHQFGGWSPLLGDGRALLIGEVVSSDGVRHDLHLKGSGATPYSRNGDGRAALGPMLREYIVSEAFAGLGIPTTRALAVVGTGEEVYRRTKEPGGILTRTARSHVRVGTFQFAAAHGDVPDLAALLNYETARNFPGLAAGESKALSFLRQVISRQALLIAPWMAAGFIHGVMNTDNMQVAGETIDFGPCAFMDKFHPQKVFSSIDHHGRYAWDQQATIAQWNLTRLAESLLPLLHQDKDQAVGLAKAELTLFMPAFENHFEALMRTKFGLTSAHPDDGAFIAQALTCMMQGEADFTLFFRRLTQLAAGGNDTPFQTVLNSTALAQTFLQLWRARLTAQGEPDVLSMQNANPVRIARNHRIEEAIQAAYAGDIAVALRLAEAVRRPFEERHDWEDLEVPPGDDEEVRQTFCGT